MRTTILVAANRHEESIPAYAVQHDSGVGHMVGVVAQQDGSARCGGFPGSVFWRQLEAGRVMRKAEDLGVYARVENENMHPWIVAMPCFRCKVFFAAVS
jgi:hypothetical protein